MTKDTANAIKLDGELTSKDLDLVSGGFVRTQGGPYFINPQPLPPLHDGIHFLNPQPLPPG
jgi:hypothetical protein